MKIHITSKKPVLTQHGRFAVGSTVEVPHQLAQFLIARGDAVAFEVKEAIDRPSLAAGEVVQSSVLPVVQALPQTIVTESAPGAKKKAKTRKTVE